MNYSRSQYRALCKRWEVLDKAVTLPDDDLCSAPPYMELSDDEDNSICCTLPGTEHQKSGRTQSNPIPEESQTRVNPRLKSPSLDNINQTSLGTGPIERSKGHKGAESVAMEANKGDIPSDTDYVSNGGKIPLHTYMCTWKYMCIAH